MCFSFMSEEKEVIAVYRYRQREIGVDPTSRRYIYDHRLEPDREYELSTASHLLLHDYYERFHNDVHTLIGDMPRLRKLTFVGSYARFDDDGEKITGGWDFNLDFVPDDSRLEEISFYHFEYYGKRHSYVQAIDLNKVEHLKHLRVITIGPSNLGLETLDFQRLGSHPTIEVINIDRNHYRLSSISLQGLNSCPNLRTIYLSGWLLQALDLSPLDGSPSLETLVIHDTIASDLFTEGYETHLNDPLRIRVPHCPSLKKFQVIELSRADPLMKIYDDQGTRYKEVLQPNRSRVAEIVLDNLRHAPKLEDLRIYGTSIQNLDLSPLAGLTSLHTISIHDNDLLETLDITPLLQVRSIEKVELDQRVRRIVETDIKREDLPQFTRHVWKVEEGERIRYRISADEVGSYDVRWDDWLKDFDVEWY